MALGTMHQSGRNFAPVFLDYGTPNFRIYYVDVSNSNPGPMVIAGELAYMNNVEYHKWLRSRNGRPECLDDASEHVRVNCHCHADTGSFKLAGLWYPYSHTIEPIGALELGSRGSLLTHGSNLLLRLRLRGAGIIVSPTFTHILD